MQWAKGHEPMKGPRCQSCRRNARRQAYYPFCSYHCQEWAQTSDAFKYLADLKERRESPEPTCDTLAKWADGEKE
jgi:endogenous inhibitor of DNA gyrase (YacG/DUF329 family)